MDSVASEVERLITDGSEYWSAIADAAGLGANVIVLVTDGQSNDPEDRAARLSLRPPGRGGPVSSLPSDDPTDQSETVVWILRAARGGEHRQAQIANSGPRVRRWRIDSRDYPGGSYLAPTRKYVGIRPLPLTSTSPRGSNSYR